MDTIFLALSRNTSRPLKLWCYQVGGHCLVVDRPVQELQPFRIQVRDAPPGSLCNQPRLLAPTRGDLIHDVEAWVVDAVRRVRLWFDGLVHEIRIEGIGAFSVSADGHEVIMLDRKDALNDSAVIEVALGPPLMLALAIRGVFCLHASAVTIGGSAILFLGDSGAGKSTMAKMLQDRRLGVTRVTDDISPLMNTDGRFGLLPDFPQLKLAAVQHSSHLPSCTPLPIDSVYCLNRTPNGKVDDPPQVSEQRFGTADAFKRLAGNTIASRLFTVSLLHSHSQQIAAMAERVPVCQLSYPSGEQYSDLVRDFLFGGSR